MNPLLRNVLIVVIVIIILFFGYRQFFLSEPLAPFSVEGGAQGVGGGGKEGGDFLAALINLNKIKLEISSSVLNDPALAKLKDKSVSLPDESSGRPNPFNPIGADSVSPETSVSSKSADSAGATKSVKPAGTN